MPTANELRKARMEMMYGKVEKKESKSASKSVKPVPIAVGFDPEVFCILRTAQTDGLSYKPNKRREEYKVVPARNFTVGVKGFYEISEYCSKGIGLLADGMAVEINTTAPATNPNDFANMCANARGSIDKHVSRNGGSITDLVSTKVFPEFKADPAFLEIGCEPDYCVYSRRMVEPIDPLKSDWRHAGGHLHISAEKLKEELDPHIIAKLCDIYVGSWRAVGQKERLKVIGPGRIRVKGRNYVEYRTLPNSWLFAGTHSQMCMFMLIQDLMTLAHCMVKGTTETTVKEVDDWAEVVRANILANKTFIEPLHILAERGHVSTNTMEYLPHAGVSF